MNRTAAINRVAGKIQAQANGITLDAAANNAEHLFTGLDSENFGIYLDAMKIANKSSGGSKLTKFKESLIRATEATFRRIKESGTPSKENAEDFCEKVKLVKAFLGEAIGTSAEMFKTIDAAGIVDRATNGLEPESKVGFKRATELFSEAPRLVDSIVGMRDATTAQAIDELAGFPEGQQTLGGTSRAPLASATPKMEPKKSAESAKTTPLATSTSTTEAKTTAPRIAPDTQAIAETIADLSVHCRIQVMMDEVLKGDTRPKEISTQLRNLAERYDARAKNALIKLYKRDRETFLRYRAIAGAYPNAFIDPATISTHASSQVDFSKVLQRLETKLNECTNPEIRETLAHAYVEAIGCGVDMTNMPDEFRGCSYDLAGAENLLDFVEKFGNFLTPKILQCAGKRAFCMRENLPHLENLMAKCEDADKKKALVELFVGNPQACRCLSILTNDSQDVPANLIDLCKASNQNDLYNAAELKGLPNVKILGEDLLQTCQTLGYQDSRRLIEYAKRNPTVEITQALANALKSNPARYR
jgi:hypothetical protein